MTERKDRRWIFFAIMAPIFAALGAWFFTDDKPLGRLDLPATPVALGAWGFAVMCIIGVFVTWPRRDKF